MKPNNRNRLACPDCGRPKLVFENEHKAKNFIKYNGADVLRNNQTIKDLRIYYCPSCCGYHISSKPYKASYSHNTENLIKRYNTNINAQTSPTTHFIMTDREIATDITKLAQKTHITSKKKNLRHY